MGLVRRLDRYGDVALALVLALLYALELWASEGGTWIGPGERRLAGAAGLLFVVALAWRRRFPLLVLALAFVPLAIARIGPQGAPNSFAFALLVGVYSVGANAAGPRAIVGLLAVVALVGAALFEDPGTLESYGDMAFIALLFGGPWIGGRAMYLRGTRERRLERHAIDLERDRDAQIREATLAERGRIARDLHDIVAHSLSLMVLQARGGRRSMAERPAETRAALEAIETVGGQALAEMQHMLELLHGREPEDAPALPSQPSLRHVDSLADHVRQAGLPVEISIDGDPIDVPPGVDVSAYRIVQEALTNVLKHAGPASARITIRYAPASLEVEIADTGRGPAMSARDGTGHGLTGMRERARLYGGWVETGPRPEGGFAVRARFPLAGDAA